MAVGLSWVEGLVQYYSVEPFVTSALNSFKLALEYYITICLMNINCFHKNKINFGYFSSTGLVQ